MCISNTKRSRKQKFASRPQKVPLGAPLAEMREAVVPKLRHQPDLFTLAATRGYTHTKHILSLSLAHTQNEHVYVCVQHGSSLNFGDE